MISSARDKILSWVRTLELLIVPSFCHLCSVLLEFPGEKIVCRKCLDKVQPDHSPHCLCCGRFFNGAGESHYCLECLAEPPPFSIHRSCARYRGELKDIILLYKYRGFQVLGRELSAFAGRSLGREEGLWQGADFLIPVPLHPKRRAQRGFNQAALLAAGLSVLTGVPILENCLVKAKNVPAQTSLEASERETNVRGAFRMARDEKIRKKTILIVDDVYTTGSTLKETSRILLEAGAREVRGMTLAQA